MIQLPFHPDDLRDGMLASYLAANPDRARVLITISEMLDADGRVGDRCRYYVSANEFRRSVLRGTLAALGIAIPGWLHESQRAYQTNAIFRAAYRDHYQPPGTVPPLWSEPEPPMPRRKRRRRRKAPAALSNLSSPSPCGHTSFYTQGQITA